VKVSMAGVKVSDGGQTESARSDGLFRYASDFENLVEVAAEVSSRGHDSMSVSQMLIFLKAAAADLAGHPTTMTDLKTELGPAIGKSIHTTYGTLLDNNGRRRAIGWLRQEENPDNRRQKFLRLTAAGREVCGGVAGRIKSWKRAQ
jgi:hypothetical protein